MKGIWSLFRLLLVAKTYFSLSPAQGYGCSGSRSSP